MDFESELEIAAKSHDKQYSHHYPNDVGWSFTQGALWAHEKFNAYLQVATRATDSCLTYIAEEKNAEDRGFEEAIQILRAEKSLTIDSGWAGSKCSGDEWADYLIQERKKKQQE